MEVVKIIFMDVLTQRTPYIYMYNKPRGPRHKDKKEHVLSFSNCAAYDCGCMHACALLRTFCFVIHLLVVGGCVWLKSSLNVVLYKNVNKIEDYDYTEHTHMHTDGRCHLQFNDKSDTIVNSLH